MDKALKRIDELESDLWEANDDVEWAQEERNEALQEKAEVEAKLKKTEQRSQRYRVSRDLFRKRVEELEKKDCSTIQCEPATQDCLDKILDKKFKVLERNLTNLFETLLNLNKDEIIEHIKDLRFRLKSDEAGLF